MHGRQKYSICLVLAGFYQAYAGYFLFNRGQFHLAEDWFRWHAVKNVF